MNEKLFMMLLGCKPEGRLTEQHDVFFSVGTSLKDLVPEINNFWPEARGKIHIDVWREVTYVDGYSVKIVPSGTPKDPEEKNLKLFFLNLGGYKENDFEEYHYKMLCVAGNKKEAISCSKETAFYRHIGFKGAPSHIDEKYGIDVDDTYEIEEILPHSIRDYRIQILHAETEAIGKRDPLNAGYLVLSKIQ